MPLTRFEQETVISFNEAEDTANVFTYNERWQRHLESLGFKAYRENSFGGKDFSIPKHMIHLPRKKMELSVEEKDRRAERARGLHLKKPLAASKPVNLQGNLC
jgi:hypothetical protein